MVDADNNHFQQPRRLLRLGLNLWPGQLCNQNGLVPSVCNTTENFTQSLIFFIQVNVIVKMIKLFKKV